LFDFNTNLNDKQERVFVECYQDLLQEVAGSKGHILIEPLNRYESRYVNTVAESLRLVARVDSPNAGLLLDCFHMSIEERSIVDAIVAAGCHTKHVHLAENNRKMPGEGSLEWPAIFGALRDSGYDGTISFECSTSGDADAAVPKSVRFIRQFLLIRAAAAALAGQARPGRPRP
jgi:sugar phosphate isomerase/epimerase